MEFNTFTFNLDTNVATRFEELEGQKHLVAPVVMITEGVHNGNNGPGFYPADENAKATDKWNHMPIIVYHPVKDGKAISARQPVVMNSSKIGLVLNTQHIEEKTATGWVVKKLRAEAWINVNRANAVDKRIIENIQNKKPTEVSTGLYTEHEPTKGEWNGEKYEWIARDHQPDHLAILPDQVGACSLKDGAGLLVNSTVFQNLQLKDGVVNEFVMLLENRDFSTDERKEMAKKGQALPDGSFPIADEGDLKNAIRAVGRSKNPSAARRHIIERAKEMGLSKLIPPDWESKPSTNASPTMGASHRDIQQGIHKALATKLGQPGKEWYGYLENVFPQHAIYSAPDNGGGLYRIGYEADDKGNVSLKGDPEAVNRTTDYQPVSTNSSAKETNMGFDKNAHIASLIGNGFAEADRVWLTNLSDEQLGKILPRPGTPPSAPAVTPPAPPVDVNTYVKTLPPAVQHVINSALGAAAIHKAALIKKITTLADGQPRPNCQFSAEYLNTCDPDFLTRVAALIPDDPTTNGMYGQSPYGPAIVPHYLGASVPSPDFNQMHGFGAPAPTEEPLQPNMDVNFADPLAGKQGARNSPQPSKN